MGTKSEKISAFIIICAAAGGMIATMKCYLADTGLLISHAFDEKGIVSEEIYRKLLFDKLTVNEGMLMENIVAQMLAVSGHKLYFFQKHHARMPAQGWRLTF